MSRRTYSARMPILPWSILAIAAALLFAWLSVHASTLGTAEEKARAAAGDGLKKAESGLALMSPASKLMQEDPTRNPGLLWVGFGERLWGSVDGKAKRSCAQCHGRARFSMRTAGRRYPRYSTVLRRAIGLEQRINRCREQFMGADPWSWESTDLLAMTAYVRFQARGLPQQVHSSGPARRYLQAGRDLYQKRIGQLDLACSHCHGDLAGSKLRGVTLSQGQSNGYPLYRFQWEAVGSLQRRIRSCNLLVRADPLAYGSEDMIALEMYLAVRGAGLPVETPAVRR